MRSPLPLAAITEQDIFPEHLTCLKMWRTGFLADCDNGTIWLCSQSTFSGTNSIHCTSTGCLNCPWIGSPDEACQPQQARPKTCTGPACLPQRHASTITLFLNSNFFIRRSDFLLHTCVWVILAYLRTNTSVTNPEIPRFYRCTKRGEAIVVR